MSKQLLCQQLLWFYWSITLFKLFQAQNVTVLLCRNSQLNVQLTYWFDARHETCPQKALRTTRPMKNYQKSDSAKKSDSANFGRDTVMYFLWCKVEKCILSEIQAFFFRSSRLSRRPPNSRFHSVVPLKRFFRGSRLSIRSAFLAELDCSAKSIPPVSRKVCIFRLCIIEEKSLQWMRFTHIWC